MRYVFTVFILSSVLDLGAQSGRIKDSLVGVMCQAIKADKNSADSSRILHAMTTHLFPYFSKMNAEAKESAWLYIHLQLQKNCYQYWEIVSKNSESNSDWQLMNANAETMLSPADCKSFLAHKSFFYLNPDKDTVNLTLNGSYWIDHFKDGTYSKLSFKWVSVSDFEIQFQESNNEMRLILNKPGEVYNYRLFARAEKYYAVITEMKKYKKFVMFKIYFRD